MPHLARARAARQDGTTGLYIASQNGHFEVVRLLLDSKADANLARKVQPPPMCCLARFRDTGAALLHPIRIAVATHLLQPQPSAVLQLQPS